MNKDTLANFFKGLREIIDAAETPFAKVVIIFLPIISPIVPAAFTTLHVYMLSSDIFNIGKYTPGVSITLGGLVGMVLELLGYVGMITFIIALFRWIRNGGWLYFTPVLLSFLAYVFYLVVMFQINYKLGQYFEVAPIINTIVGWLSFLTVPTGLLAANNLAQRDQDERDEKNRRDNNEFKLQKLAVKKGWNPFGGPQQPQPQSGKYKDKPASHYRDKIREHLQTEYDKNRRVLTPKEITTKLNLNHDKAKGFVSTETGKWCDENHIPRPKDEKKSSKSENVPERSDP